MKVYIKFHGTRVEYHCSLPEPKNLICSEYLPLPRFWQRMGKGLATSSLCDAIVCIWVTLPLPFIRWGCGSAVQHCGWRLFEPRFKSMILYPVFLHYIHEARPVRKLELVRAFYVFHLTHRLSVGSVKLRSCR